MTLFSADPAALQQAVAEYFAKYDADNNGSIDRKELRQFLAAFFEEFAIKLPITDEFVDATFRELDQDRNNAIEAEELQAYAAQFMGTLNKLYNP